METLWWSVRSGLLMSAIALSGSITLLLSESALRRVLTPLVAFAAGALLGGAFFHMIPAAADPDRRRLAQLSGQPCHWRYFPDRHPVGCAGMAGGGGSRSAAGIRGLRRAPPQRLDEGVGVVAWRPTRWPQVVLNIRGHRRACPRGDGRQASGVGRATPHATRRTRTDRKASPDRDGPFGEGQSRLGSRDVINPSVAQDPANGGH